MIAALAAVLVAGPIVKQVLLRETVGEEPSYLHYRIKLNPDGTLEYRSQREWRRRGQTLRETLQVTYDMEGWPLTMRFVYPSETVGEPQNLRTGLRQVTFDRKGNANWTARLAADFATSPKKSPAPKGGTIRDAGRLWFHRGTPKPGTSHTFWVFLPRDARWGKVTRRFLRATMINHRSLRTQAYLCEVITENETQRVYLDYNGMPIRVEGKNYSAVRTR